MWGPQDTVSLGFNSERDGGINQLITFGDIALKGFSGSDSDLYKDFYKDFM